MDPTHSQAEALQEPFSPTLRDRREGKGEGAGNAWERQGPRLGAPEPRASLLSPNKKLLFGGFLK